MEKESIALFSVFTYIFVLVTQPLNHTPKEGTDTNNSLSSI